MDSRAPKQAKLTDFFGSNISQQRQDPQNRPSSAQAEEQSKSQESTSVSAEITDYETVIDIRKYLEAAIEDETKYKVLTKHWSPSAEFVFPNVARAETSGN